MPAVKRVQQRFLADGLVVIGFNSDTQRATMDEYLAKNGYGGWSHWPLGSTGHEIPQRFWVSGWPTNFLIGRDGRILSRRIRFGTPEAEAEVAAALAAPAPAGTETSGSGSR